MEASVCSSLSDVDADDWNRLAGADNPFVCYEFLAALEQTGCVNERSGWLVQHLLIRSEQQLVGAIPIYVKNHSYGEYVFDWAWADAYQRHGIRYFPKLVVAIPFTPATGPRLLCDPRYDTPELRRGLVEAVIELADQSGLSSAHFLFTDPLDTQAMREAGLLMRMGCQYHWENQGFRDFEDFLDAFNSKKRKQIKRERRLAKETGFEVCFTRAKDLTESQWRSFYAFYCETYDRKWGSPYLTLEFFLQIAETMPERVSPVIAQNNNALQAGALCLHGKDTLYGRNWGCREYHSALHFEMCYYQTIEHCITNGLGRFEAGAQGEYKMSRGLMPTSTWSAHWIKHPQFRDAIANYLEEEQAGIERYIEHMQTQHPFKKT